MRAAALALVPLLSGCCVGTMLPDDCESLIDKVVICDSTAATTPRSVLRYQCVWTNSRCVTLPVGTPAECNAFLGCLYDD